MEKNDANVSRESDFKSSACIFRWDYSVLHMEREEAKSCCRVFPRSIPENELTQEGKNIFNNSSFEKQQRLSMLQGGRPTDCQSCWNLEDRGFRSPRAPLDLFLPFWNSREETRNAIQPFVDSQNKVDWKKLSENVDEKSVLLNAKPPRMLEISLGNLCDMKCIYCNDHYSSSWATEKIKFGDLTLEEYNRTKKKSHEQFETTFWQWFTDEVRFEPVYINFLGGEPLINPQFYQYVERMMTLLKEAGNQKCILSLVTNLNMSKEHLNRFLELLPKLCEVFIKVDLNVSMESVGEKAEYIRSGVKWSRWSSNFESLARVQNPKLELSLQMAMNALNVTSIESYLRYAKKVYDEVRIPFHARQNIVSFPQILAPTVLPASFAQPIYEAAKFVRSIEKEMAEICQFEWGRWDYYGNFLQRLGESIEKNQDHNPSLRADFYDYFTKLDQRRGTSFLKTFPEYADFWKDCEKESLVRKGHWMQKGMAHKMFASLKGFWTRN